MLSQEQIKVGIIGYGVIGMTFAKWLKEHTSCQMAISDPPKGINEDISDCHIYFNDIGNCGSDRGVRLSFYATAENG